VQLPADAGRQVWPPAELAAHYARLAELSAWYGGQPGQLAGVYAGAGTHPLFSSQPDRSRLRFWSRRARDTSSQTRGQLHVPLAGDIAATAADLLMGTAPTVSWAEDDPANELLQLMGSDLATVWLEGAEVCAALGGVYLRPAWDASLEPRPLLTVVQPDAACPTWQLGRLTQVTFWQALLPLEGDTGTWRWLETHHMVNGRWHVLHQLYRGDRDRLGVEQAYAAHPDTADLDPRYSPPEGFDTGLPRLGVAYVPNMRPNREDRGSAAGRADVAGCEGLLDALDEAWTSWMRDLRLAKARLIVPDTYLDTPGRGQGQTFDQDRELFTPIAVPTNVAKGAELELVQPSIRHEEHLATVLALVERIVSDSGYSPQDFGLHIEGRAESGTALRLRRGRTLATIARKQRYWTPALARSSWALVGLARGLPLGAPAGAPPEQEPEVTWPEELDLAETAKTVSLVSQAQAASAATRVKWLHPDWDDSQVKLETAAILREQGMELPDPMQLGTLP
jgi:hypothetical protein